MRTTSITANGRDSIFETYTKVHNARDVWSTAENRVNRSSRQRHSVRPRETSFVFPRHFAPPPGRPADIWPFCRHRQPRVQSVFTSRRAIAPVEKRIFFLFFINRPCIIIGRSMWQRVSKDPILKNLSKSQSICTQEHVSYD